MALLGNNIRQALDALSPQEEPPLELTSLVEQLKRDAQLEGERGFKGEKNSHHRATLKTRAESIVPSISKHDAELAADLAAKSLERTKARTELVMKIVVTCFCLVAGMAILITQNDETLKKWASGLIGTAVGYWLG